MYLRLFALIAILGLSAPAAVAAATVLPPARGSAPRTAQASDAPLGTFSDDIWTVNLWFEDNTYHYVGENERSGSRLELAGARQTRESTRDRRVYAWDNSGYTYQVAWQPRDPDFLRLQVFDPNGNEMLNRLLERARY